ncbi:MAG: UDP-N-acetylmuramate--alanine ligase [Actinomycetota bacterium]|nr:UDP-N-acetylmuramate--alanine ligase [Actinomycetota bacterium]
MNPLLQVEVVPADQLGAVHFIGIGGGGMSGIARIMLTRGVTVSGSDAKEARVLAALRVLGARVHVGHDPNNLGTADTVVVSTAIQESNPELIEARRRGLRVIPRAAALASVMAGRRGVAVAGTHGKTTTTSMLARALQHTGAEPSFAIGADLNEPGSNAHDGAGDIFVAEADESDESFLLLSPFAAIVTNVEADHLNHYGGLDEIHDAFERFAHRIAPDGFLVVCADDEGAIRLGAAAAAAGVDVRTYGEAADADVRVANLVLAGTGSSFEVVADGTRLGEVTLRVPGRHNALNAAGALTIGLGLGVPFAGFASGLTVFTGARRRFEPKGVVAGVRVFDDYAHHPTEVAATLRAAREVAGGGRLVVAFQAHHYYRTADFCAEFGAALGLADDVVVMEVYAPGEAMLPGGTGTALAAAVTLPPEHVVFEPSWSAVPAHLAQRARSGDLVVTMGAGGEVAMLAPEVIEALRTGSYTTSNGGVATAEASSGTTATTAAQLL